VLDVHPPHEAAHGWRDFLIHLFTITIGLLIALSLEGLVEWQHHKHLTHDAETSMTAEIKSNADGMTNVLADLQKEQDSLKHDVIVLNSAIKTGKLPTNSSMDITFHIRTFDDLSWRTAQTTGALAYMPYDQAAEFADIYSEQDALAESEREAARDAATALAPFINNDLSEPGIDAARATAIKQTIEVLQGQLLIVDSFMKNLDRSYKKFVAAHPK
jgi:hypothetical protein